MPKIRTLLIDNGSQTIDKYERLFKSCSLSVVPIKQIQTFLTSLNEFQLIILSDGHDVNIRDNHFEQEIVQNCSIPIIGVCYGFQLISYVHGAQLKPLIKKRTGFQTITITSGHQIFKGESTAKIYENHSYAVTNIKKIPALGCHAFSEDGCEIVEVIGKQQFGFQFHPEFERGNNDGEKFVNNLIEYWFF